MPVCPCARVPVCPCARVPVSSVGLCIETDSYTSVGLCEELTDPVYAIN